MRNPWFFIVVLLIASWLAYIFRVLPVAPVAVDLTPKPAPIVETPPVKEDPIPPSKTKKLSAIPFYVQAPFGVWDALHEETCEEASLYMVKYWLDGATPSLEHFDQDLKNFVSWQTDHGYGVSMSTDEVKQAAHDYLGMDLTIKTIGNINELKAIIDEGNPIIFPADGKRLNNPNFSDGGPVYHMLVVNAYSGDTFTTLDPGTRAGKNYAYSAANLSESLGGWDGQRVDLTDRRVLVFEQ